MPGGRFKLLAGVHTEQNGTVYTAGKGDAGNFESPDDLDVMFANKFERLSGPTKVPAARDESLDFAGTVMDAPLHQRQKGAVKARAEGKPHAVAPFTGEDVVQRPAGKMAPREGGRAGEEFEEDVEEHKAKAKATTKTEEEETDQDFGADVTDQFEQAEKAGVSVFKSEKGYHVVKDDKPLRKTPFGTKKEVNEWVRKNKDKFPKEATESAEEEAVEE